MAEKRRMVGMDVKDALHDTSLPGVARSHVVSPLKSSDEILMTTLQFAPTANTRETNLVSRMLQPGARLPQQFLAQMKLRDGIFGYVGTEDHTLYPIIRPGSFVQIDVRQRKITRNWKDEHDRPIYFFELRDGFACSWCELHDRRLILLPTPQSGARARNIRYPDDVDILGRVTAVSMRIVDFGSDAKKSLPPG